MTQIFVAVFTAMLLFMFAKIYWIVASMFISDWRSQRRPRATTTDRRTRPE